MEKWYKTDRAKLFFIWFGGFIISFIQLLVFAACGYTVMEALYNNIVKIFGIFGPYLTPIISFWFVSRKDKGSNKHSKMAYIVASLCSLFFVVVVNVFIASIWFREGGELIERTLEFTFKTAALFTIFVGPAIGFFFGEIKKVDEAVT